MRREKKQEIAVNLVRHQDDDTYRIVDDLEMMRLKASGRVYFEKSRTDKRMVGSFYIQIGD